MIDFIPRKHQKINRKHNHSNNRTAYLKEQGRSKCTYMAESQTVEQSTKSASVLKNKNFKICKNNLSVSE